MTIKAALFLALGVVTLSYTFYWIYRVRRDRPPVGTELDGELVPIRWSHAVLGFVTNFLDALGIGSFAPTTSVFKLRHMVPDEKIPGTLNVGHALPVIAQAFIYIAILEISMDTLLLMISASVAGAWLGAGVVASWPRKRVQFGMGMALLAAGTFFVMTNLGLFPSGGETLGLTGGRLTFGLLGNAMLGALMTLGIGLYAPCMILVSLLGMNPKAAFPIMMGSCAFLMPAGGARFISRGSYSLGPAIGLALGGIPGVLVAAFIVKSLPLTTVRWLVVVVVIYTAAAMLYSAFSEKPTPGAAAAGG